jgi:hypothetical protein
VLTELKVVLSCVPTAVTAAMIKTEISAAMSPYSMAVAPTWFLKNETSRLFSSQAFKNIDFMVRGLPFASHPTCTGLLSGALNSNGNCLACAHKKAPPLRGRGEINEGLEVGS